MVSSRRALALACAGVISLSFAPAISAGDLSFGPRHDQALEAPAPQLPSPAAGGDIVNQVAGVTGGSPFGIAVVGLGGNERVYIGDLGSGFTEVYDLGLNALGITLPNPGGTNMHTGLAWNADDLELYWMDTTAELIYVTSLNGVVESSFSLTSPAGGTIGGLTYDPDTDTLWGVDVMNDLYFEFDTTGTPTGESFDSPLGTSFGNGISHVGGSACFDIPVGTLGAGQVEDIFRVGNCGGVIFFSLLAVGDSFINGNAWHATGSMGLDVNYVVGNATNTIFEIETGAAPCGHLPIDDFVCSYDDATGEVTATWDVNGVYDAIVVLRNGDPVSSPPGPTDTSLVDTPPLGIAYVYTIESVEGAESCLGGTCEVFAATSCDLVVDNFPGDEPFGITFVESTQSIFVGSLFAGNYRVYDRNLDLLGSGLMAPGGDTTHTGIAWDPTSDHVFWIDVGTETLWETDTNGTVITSFPLANPGGGLQGGMDILPDGSGLIINDATVDACYAYNFDGTAISPDPLFALPGPFGNGVATLPPSAAAFPGFEIPSGTDADGQPVSLITVDESGSPVGCEVGIGTPDDFIDDVFVNGVVLSEFTPDTCATGIARYAVGNATNQVYATAYECTPPVGTEFIRGDVNGDGGFNPLVDGVFVLNFGFIPGSATPPCLAAADANGDDAVNPLVEAVHLLNFGFIPGSPPIPAPYPECGLDEDTVSAVGCEISPCP